MQIGGRTNDKACATMRCATRNYTQQPGEPGHALRGLRTTQHTADTCNAVVRPARGDSPRAAHEAEENPLRSSTVPQSPSPIIEWIRVIIAYSLSLVYVRKQDLYLSVMRPRRRKVNQGRKVVLPAWEKRAATCESRTQIASKGA